MNDLVRFYQEQVISPVHQDLSDFSAHCRKREKLYRQLGIPVILFGKSKILEVGPGGGYNSIVLKHWGGDLTLVEPNETGCREIKCLFSEFGYTDYKIYNIDIEEFEYEQQFDIVIAEGFLPVIDNWEQVINKLKSLVGSAGILVITCEDEMGRFVERVKRFVGHVATRGLQDYDEKLKRLIELFTPQLRMLKYKSRPVKDWVEDEILFKDYLKRTLTMKKAIEWIGDDWDVLGCSSPSCFVDYSWYKDIDIDYKKDFCKQYEKKLYNLLLAGREEIAVDEGMVKKVQELVHQVSELDILYEKSGKHNEDYVEQVIGLLNQLSESVSAFDGEFSKFLQEAVYILENQEWDDNLGQYINFSKTFGRSSQYISFVKRIT